MKKQQHFSWPKCNTIAQQYTDPTASNVLEQYLTKPKMGHKIQDKEAM